MTAVVLISIIYPYAKIYSAVMNTGIIKRNNENNNKRLEIVSLTGMYNSILDYDTN